MQQDKLSSKRQFAAITDSLSGIVSQSGHTHDPRAAAALRGAQAEEQTSGEGPPTRGPLPVVLFNGEPARSVWWAPDGSLIAEAPLPEGLPLVRIEGWIKP